MIIKNSYDRVKKEMGFSLLEVMLSSIILLIIIVSLLYTYTSCFELNEFSRGFTLANNALQAEMETIREVPFDNLSALDASIFSLDGFSPGEAVGVIAVYDSLYSDLKYIRLVGFWRQKSGRVIGEDSNLDGVLQIGEDIDGDNTLDSPAEIITLVSQVQ